MTISWVLLTSSVKYIVSSVENDEKKICGNKNVLSNARRTKMSAWSDHRRSGVESRHIISSNAYMHVHTFARARVNTFAHTHAHRRTVACTSKNVFTVFFSGIPSLKAIVMVKGQSFLRREIHAHTCARTHERIHMKCRNMCLCKRAHEIARK